MFASVATVVIRNGDSHGIPDEKCVNRSVALTSCICCGEGSWTWPFPNRVCWLAACPRCGMQFCSPQPSEGELSAIYNGDYYKAFGFESGCNGVALRALKQTVVERFFRLIERFAGAPGMLLDVGCGLGDVLVIGQRRGWEVCGIEPNPRGVSESELIAPNAIFAGTVEEYRSDGCRFRLITCFDVFEHLRRPDMAAEKMHRLLLPGGVLLLTVPDTGSLLAGLMGPRWPHYHRDHLWYFNRRNLRRLIEARGFEVLHHGAAWKTFNLRYVLGILAANPHTGLFHRIAKATKDRLPRLLLNLRWPAIPEGQLLIARKQPRAARDD